MSTKMLSVLMILILSSSLPIYAAHAASSGYQSYQNTQYGFSVEYPKGWNVVEHTGVQYAAKTVMISPDANLQINMGVFKNNNPYKGLTNQEILGSITAMMRSGCSNSSMQNRGFACTGPQFMSNVTSYNGVPLYGVVMTWTKTFSTSPPIPWISMWGMIPSGNDVWLVIVEGSQDEFVKYQSEIGHVTQSLDITSISKQNISTQGSTSTQPASTSHAIPGWIKNTVKLWSGGSLADDDFIKALQYLIQQGIIVIPSTQVSSNQNHGVPSWVKNTVKLWSEGQVGDNDFINGLQYLIQNGIISASTNNPTQVTTTDQNGIATFQISSQNIPFQFVDDTTGQPLAGANVVLTVDSNTTSLGTLLVIDPSKHYPIQVIMLIPSEASSTTPASLKNYLIPFASAQTEEAVKVSVTTSIKQAGNLLPVSFLHKVQHVGHVVDTANLFYDLLALSLKTADKNGWLPVSQYLQNHGYETGIISTDEAIDKIKEENKQGKIIDGLFLMGSGGATMPGYLISRTTGEITAKMDINTVTGCGSQQVQYVEVGPAIFYNCPSDKTAGLVKYDPPTETADHVSLDLLSKANQGFGERVQTEQGQPVPVPADDYTANISAPGKTPVTQDITVTPDQITPITTMPKPIQNNAITTVITPARDLSGNWGGTYSMHDTTSDGCSFSGSWQATMTQSGNDLTGTIVILSASSPDYPANDYCTWNAPDFSFDGTVSSSSFQISAGGDLFTASGSFTTDLIRGNFNECSDGSCASGTFTGSRR